MEEEVKRFCPNCHSLVRKNSKYCANCGHSLVEEVEDNKDIKTKPIHKKKNIKFDLHIDTNSKYFLPIVSSLLTLVICTIFTCVICNSMRGNGTTNNIVADHKNVTITDTGIAEAVDKVYDSTVVVETYAKNQIYATGTGFVFKLDDKYGYILTNNHVIESGSNIKVIFTNNEEVDVTVVGADSYSDIAVLKVDKSKVLSVADIGSSKDLKVGSTTFAVGAPLDATTYSWTVTRGILSGKDRVVEISGSNSSSSMVMSVLQTDTAINNGNSGGPLCNANGEVIGITNMKIASSSVEGMGFAIPIETALEYTNHFINGDPITRPYIGIGMYDLSNSFFSNQTGIYIQSVEKDSPAEKAGLQKGDVITKIDGKEVETSAYLKYELYKHNVGDKITITFNRDGKEQSVDVTLGSYDITM